MCSSDTVFKTQKLKWVYITDPVSCENEHLFVRRLVNSVLHHLRKPKVCDVYSMVGCCLVVCCMCYVQYKVDFQPPWLVFFC